MRKKITAGVLAGLLSVFGAACAEGGLEPVDSGADPGIEEPGSESGNDTSY